jgi:hypothetical protein
LTTTVVRGIRFPTATWDEVMAQADRLSMSPGAIIRESVDFFLEKFVRFMEPAGAKELV